MFGSEIKMSPPKESSFRGNKKSARATKQAKASKPKGKSLFGDADLDSLLADSPQSSKPKKYGGLPKDFSLDDSLHNPLSFRKAKKSHRGSFNMDDSLDLGPALSFRKYGGDKKSNSSAMKDVDTKCKKKYGKRETAFKASAQNQMLGVSGGKAKKKNSGRGLGLGGFGNFAGGFGRNDDFDF